jgi:hypothetical protein
MAMSIDDWMHATEEERVAAQQSWNVENGDGKDIVKHIASIFTDECVYEVEKTRAGIKSGKWIIETFSDDHNYDTLKTRTNINFLGFDVLFYHIDDL